MKRWVANYEQAKAEWLGEAERIIQKACDTGLLVRDEGGKFANLDEKTKEAFLVTLDRRHFVYFSAEEREQLGTNIVPLFMGATRALPAIRFSSLSFWYAYICSDKGYPMKRKGSDLGDFFHLSLIPYCSAFTTDTTMSRLARRVLRDAPCACRVYDHDGLDAALGLMGTIGTES